MSASPQVRPSMSSLPPPFRRSARGRRWLSFGVSAAAMLATLGAIPRAVAADAEPPDEELTADAPAAHPGEAQFWQALLLLDESAPDKQRSGRELLRDAADAEYPPAQFVYAECHLWGNAGFKKHERRAVDWYRLAGERGYTPAKAMVGLAYATGTGTRQDAARAQQWLRAAVDEASAFRPPTPPAWFFERQSAQAPSTRPVTSGPPPWEAVFAAAHHQLAQLLATAGEATEAQRHFEAAAHYGENARAGVSDAARMAAMNYALGRGVKRDLKKANQLLEHSRKLIQNRGLTSFRNLWSRNQVDDFDLADFEQALTTAAGEQLQEEMQNVADALVRESPAEAIKWCEIAAEAGEAWAMIKLAELHRSGTAGAPDPARMFEWYRKAAEEKDVPLAWGNLVVCLRRGLGTTTDVARADAIVTARASHNYMCALAGADVVPTKDLSGASWQALLEETAKAGRLPIAQYHHARQYAVAFDQLRNAGIPGFNLVKLDPWVFPMMQGAADAGVTHAHLFTGWMLETGLGSPRDLLRARVYFQKGVDAGSSDCALRLATLEKNVRGPERDVQAAIRYYERAIELNPDNSAAHNDLALTYHEFLARDAQSSFAPGWREKMTHHYEEANRLESPFGAYNLAMLAYEGVLVPQDFLRAYDNFQLAAERGHVIAHRFLGQMHQRGEGVPVTPKDAVYYYRVAALENDLPSLRVLCDMYLSQGTGVLNYDQAKFWLARLMARGDLGATTRFGEVLMRQELYSDALKLWTDLAKHPNANIVAFASEKLAHMYEAGLGVKPNRRRAEQYRRKAVASGDAEVLCNLSRRLIVEKKSAEAVPHLEAAVAIGSAEAHYLLGCLYFAGDGVPQDEANGWRLVRFAAERGYTEAKLNLAIATLKGTPGAPDLEQAIRYAQEAEVAGLKNATLVRQKLEAKREQAPVETESGQSRSA